jgi:uncharacterized protein (DUF1330 family)
MAKGFWVVTANIADPEGFTPYRETAGAIALRKDAARFDLVIAEGLDPA